MFSCDCGQLLGSNAKQYLRYDILLSSGGQLESLMPEMKNLLSNFSDSIPSKKVDSSKSSESTGFWWKSDQQAIEIVS